MEFSIGKDEREKNEEINKREEKRLMKSQNNRRVILSYRGLSEQN